MLVSAVFGYRRNARTTNQFRNKLSKYAKKSYTDTRTHRETGNKNVYVHLKFGMP
jgi:hypothetical protein